MSRSGATPRSLGPSPPVGSPRPSCQTVRSCRPERLLPATYADTHRDTATLLAWHASHRKKVDLSQRAGRRRSMRTSRVGLRLARENLVGGIGVKENSPAWHHIGRADGALEGPGSASPRERTPVGRLPGANRRSAGHGLSSLDNAQRGSLARVVEPTLEVRHRSPAVRSVGIVHFLAMRRRCQASSVAGVTMRCRRRSRGAVASGRTRSHGLATRDVGANLAAKDRDFVE